MMSAVVSIGGTVAKAVRQGEMMVGAVKRVSVSMLPMSQWRDGLWAELFDDTLGDGRPVSIIHVDDELFARAINRQGFSLSGDEARRAFLAAFPNRLKVQRWLAGSEDPGEALLPLLMLCCLAASEVADSDDNDYRGRLRDLMGWNERIINCAWLPRLWSRLSASTERWAKRSPTRRLILPDPRFRTQIGHAIELTFPSRNDSRRLALELAGRTFDLDAPRAVLAWLTPLVVQKRFSSTFEETFSSFRAAWLANERALADHRFWSGWKLATQSLRDRATAEPFEIVSDEWGGWHLIDPATEATLELDTVLRSRTIAPSLVSAAAKAHTIPLAEAEWGRLRWLGSDRAQTPSALLIRQKAFGSRYANLGCVSVSGAAGWGLTFDVQAGLGDRGPIPDCDRLLEVMPTGCTRVDGGVLARPALPFFIETTGLISSLALTGESADYLALTRIDTQRWQVTPQVPIDGDVRVVAEPSGGGMNLERVLRLRRSALVPSFREDPPERLFDPDPAPKPGWPYVHEMPGDACELSPAGVAASASALLDLVEYLAVRTAPIPLGEFVELVRSAVGEEDITPWDIIQSLRDAGVVKVLDVRGWRGRVLLSKEPRCALVRLSYAWGLVAEGCASETWIKRLDASAEQHGLTLEQRFGVGAWSLPTFMIQSTDLQALREVAQSIDAPVNFLTMGLDAIETLRTGAPLDKAPNSSRERSVQLSGRYAPIAFVDTEKLHTPPFWGVKGPDGTRYWKARDDAVLDAYSSVGERPFEIVGGRLVARHARLPSQVARWMRLVSGVAAGPIGEGYGYAWNAMIKRELARVSPAFFGERASLGMAPTSPFSRRWPLRAVATTRGPRVMPGWSAARVTREGE